MDEITNRTYGLNKVNAIIIDQANPRQLADAIIRAKEHPTELSSIAKAGKELYKKELSIEQLTKQLRLLFA